MGRDLTNYQTMNQMDYNFDKFNKKWALSSSIVNLLGVIIALSFHQTWAWKAGVCIIFMVFLIKMPTFLKPMPLILGYANWVSITRLLMVFSLFIFYKELSDILLFSLFLIAILFDGLDGYLARKFNHVSKAGGVLDMETDAFLVLALSWIHVEQQRVEWWILIPGGFRYTYEIMFFWKRNWKEELLPKIVRATIAVSFFITLLIPFITVESPYIFLLYISEILIILSFSISIFHQINFNKL